MHYVINFRYYPVIILYLIILNKVFLIKILDVFLKHLICRLVNFPHGFEVILVIIVFMN